jgi:hypothetical protein
VQLKVSVGYLDGWIGEGQMSYGGPGAVARAQLAREVVLKRLELMGVKMHDVRAELIGMDSLHGPRSSVEPWECACAWRRAAKPAAMRCASAMKWKPSTPTARPAAAVPAKRAASGGGGIVVVAP